jgi:hypothetical protein
MAVLISKNIDLHEMNSWGSMALTTLFETGIKHPIMQPIDGIEPAIGCLVSFEYGYCYNK